MRETHEGKSSGMKGHHHKEQTKRKISESLFGRKHPEESILRGGLHPMFGKKRPDTSERNKKAIGPLSPMFGKKRPDFSNRMKNRVGSLHPKWKGGRIKTSDGYILLLFRSHPRADKDGYVFEHILVMEEKLGRPVTKTERVHHFDEVRSNNRPENLAAFPNNQKHQDYHRFLKRLNKELLPTRSK